MYLSLILQILSWIACEYSRLIGSARESILGLVFIFDLNRKVDDDKEWNDLKWCPRIG